MDVNVFCKEKEQINEKNVEQIYPKAIFADNSVQSKVYNKFCVRRNQIKK